MLIMRVSVNKFRNFLNLHPFFFSPRTSILPALFIFEKASISTSNCASSLLNYGMKSDKPVLV